MFMKPGLKTKFEIQIWGRVTLQLNIIKLDMPLNWSKAGILAFMLESRDNMKSRRGTSNAC